MTLGLELDASWMSPFLRQVKNLTAEGSDTSHMLEIVMQNQISDPRAVVGYLPDVMHYDAE